MPISIMRKWEYIIIFLVGLAFIVAGITYLFIDLTIGLILIIVGLGITAVYYYFFLIRAKLKNQGLAEVGGIGPTQECVIVLLIVFFSTIITMMITNTILI